MSFRISYDIVHTLTQYNACHIGKATLSFRHQNRTMHVISDKIRSPIITNTGQCMSQRKSYDVLETLEKTMNVISEKLRYPSDSNTDQYMSYRTSYDFLHTLTQNNAYLSDKLRCPSDSNTEQHMSYRKSYDVLQTIIQNNACHIGQATMSLRH